MQYDPKSMCIIGIIPYTVDFVEIWGDQGGEIHHVHNIWYNRIINTFARQTKFSNVWGKNILYRNVNKAWISCFKMEDVLIQMWLYKIPIDFILSQI
jgi:hypothetical protein